MTIQIKRTNLPVAIPPMLEQTIGYQGEACLVAFFFDAGDEACFADGHVTPAVVAMLGQRGLAVLGREVVA